MGFSFSDLNPMSVVSNVIQAVSHEVLPKNLQFLGDVAALGVDYQSGNWLKGLADVQKFLADLPQGAPTSDGQAGSGPGTGNPRTQHSEPSPPPWYRASGVAGAAVNTIAQAVRGGPPPTTATTANTSALTTTPPTASTTQSPPASATQLPPTGSHTASAPATTSPAAASASTSSSSTSAPDDPFFRLSDADLMNKVVSGQVPDSISKDPAKMQQLQARMNQISEMNQLISQMMAAIHEMHRQVIQNIRA